MDLLERDVPARLERTANPIVLRMRTSSPQKSRCIIGQNMVERASFATPSSWMFPTTPMISRQGASRPTRTRLPSAALGSSQYSRAKFSVTTTTVAVL